MFVPTTPTDIAKNAVQMIVAAKATGIVAEQLEMHTEMDPDGLAVKVVSTASGQFVAMRLKPVTDEIVERTASRIKQWRKKDKETTVTE